MTLAILAVRPETNQAKFFRDFTTFPPAEGTAGTNRLSPAFALMESDANGTTAGREFSRRIQDGELIEVPIEQPAEQWPGQFDWLETYRRHQAKLERQRIKKQQRQGPKPIGPVPVAERQIVATKLDDLQDVIDQPWQSAEQLTESSLPRFVRENGFTDYVIQCRFFSKCGYWPGGTQPRRPNMVGLVNWQCSWIKCQTNQFKFEAWNAKHRESIRIKRQQKRERLQAERIVNQEASVKSQPEPQKLGRTVTTMAEYFLARKQKVAS
jgi:hypothetical protein